MVVGIIGATGLTTSRINRRAPAKLSLRNRLAGSGENAEHCPEQLAQTAHRVAEFYPI